MSANLRQTLISMGITLLVLLLLSLWQIGFVVEAIMANVMLNGLIIGVFGFGVWLVFRGVIKLKNEELAFSALKEMQQDVKNQLSGKITDPLWRHYRCNDLAIVFKKPEVLSQAFNLLSDKLSAGRELSVDPGTMATLVESVQTRLDDRKSMTQYVAGILVMLGLIGTFLGLMITLSSIGSIIGSIDLSGDDPTAAVSGLMASLQVPLQGMATGFSSSLFGLITSLVLGLMVRFSGGGFSNFTNEFESWLGNIVEIGNDSSEEELETGPVSNLSEARQLALIMRTARVSVSSNARLNDKMAGLIEAIDKLAVNSLKHSHALENLLNGTNELQQNGRILAHASRKSLEGIVAATANLNARDEIIEATIALSNQLETRDSHLVGSIQALDTQLQILRQRDEEFETRPNKEQQDIYSLLQELKANLKEGDLAGLNDRLWANEDAPEISGSKQRPQNSQNPAQSASGAIGK